MARAKLTGSLLACNDPLPAITPTQRISTPSTVSVDPSFANRFESVGSAWLGSNCTDAPMSAQVAAVAGRSGSASPTEQENRRFGPIIRSDLAIFGIGAMTAVGIVMFMLCTGRNIRYVPEMALEIICSAGS